MPRNRFFRRKLRKFDLRQYDHYETDSNGSSDEELTQKSMLARCSTPAAAASAECETPNFSAVENDSPSIFNGDLDPIQILVDEDDMQVSNYSDVSSDFENIGDESQNGFDESNDERLWQKIICNGSSKLSVSNLSGLLVAIQAAFRIPDVAMDAFCKLLSHCLPAGNSAPSSYSACTKQFLSMDAQIGQMITYICSGIACKSIFGQLIGICPNFACTFYNQRQQASGFLLLEIRPQIEKLVRWHYSDILHYLSTSGLNSTSSSGDIPTTPAYLALGPNPAGDTLFISLIISSDGAQAFKMSRTSFWPCVAIVAELPPTVRASAENAIAFGFWVGRGAKAKPEWDSFLPAIIAELQVLEHGLELEVEGRTIRIAVRIFATIFDLPAQASIWGVKQFNGNFGCIRCMHPGQRHGAFCLWPWKDDRPAIKDGEFYQSAWNILTTAAPGSSYYGVSRITPLSRICNPATSNIFDPMHLVYRGNAHLIFNRLFTNQPNKWTAIFTPSLLKDLDSIISLIRFPHYFNRKIPPLNSISTFKASEMKNLLLYAILPITASFMQDIPDYWHWMAIYVHAIRLLSQPTVSANDTSIAQTLLDTWQKLIPEFCHENSLSYNSHAVLHLPDQVNRFGPLWSVSTFAFESFNGHFARYIKASKGVLLQLGRHFVLHKAAFAYLSAFVHAQRDPMDSVIRSLFPDLHSRWSPQTECTRYRLLNPTTPSSVANTHLELIKQRFPDNDVANLQVAPRATVGSTTLHSLRHSAKTASVIKYVDLQNDLGYNYAEIALFFLVKSDIYAIIQKYKVTSRTNILEVPPPENESLFSLYDDRFYGSFFYIAEKTEGLDVLMLSDIICGAVTIESHGSMTITDLLPFEHD